MKVSFVFPYVDGSDPAWRKEYAKWFGNELPERQRFRDLGFLKYVFCGIEENLPWIDEVVMLVSSQSQVPGWLRNVRIVEHKEFIPEELLPVFNSNAIEMFLADVPGLNEGIIYSNDDFIPIGKMEYNDYFTSDGLPRMSYSEKIHPSSSYQK